MDKQPKYSLFEDAQIREALCRILDGERFRGHRSRSHFLKFIVEETLAGRSDRIKGTTIALEVYDRGVDFDPQSDPIVRVEARKLRRDLEHFYLTEGVDENIIIEVPKGGYVPVIKHVDQRAEGESVAPDVAVNDKSVRQPSADASKERPKREKRWKMLATLAVISVLLIALVIAVTHLEPDTSGDNRGHISGPNLFVTPFLAASGAANEIALARGVAIETSNALTRFGDLKVYPVGSDYLYETTNSARADVAFILSGVVQLAGENVQVTAQLQQASVGLLVWSKRYASDLVPDQIFKIQQAIADSVTKQLAEPFALIGDLSRQQLVSNKNPSLFSYDCVLKGYEYRATFEREKHGLARDCLEDAVQTDPQYSRAWALLAYVYADEYRFFYNQRPNSYRRALEAGRKAVELDPKDALSYQALSVALFGNGEIEAALEAGRKAVKLNPHNTEALIQMGYRTYATGRWDEGMKLVEEAIAASPSPPQWYPWVLALYHFHQKNYVEARNLAEAAGLSNLVLFEATRTAIYGQLGLTEESTRSLAQVRKVDPLFDQRARDWFSVHNLPNDFLDSIMEGLQKAGVQRPE